MSKYIIDVGDAYKEYICGKGDMLCLPVRINEFEDNWLNTNIPLTPYTEPDTEKVREKAYEDGYKTAKVQCNIQAEKDLREVGERHYQKGYQDATVKISSDEQAIAEKAYQSGLKDAWEAARKIAEMVEGERQYVFGDPRYSFVMEIFSASEAIEKIKAYEQEQKEIKVGDEVKWNGDESDAMFVVTHISEDGYISGITSEEQRYDRRNPEKWTKTGRRFPELAEILAKMKEKS